MKITRPTVAALAACAALVLGSAAATQAQTDSQPSVTTTSGTEQLDGVAVRAGNEAVLVQMCRNAGSDPEGRSQFDASAASHPDLASQLDASCLPISLAP